MNKNKVIGVYCIKNKENDKKYIGSSVDVHKRLAEHKRHLEKEKHHSYLLQRAWNKYGEKCFGFSIIEYSDKECLRVREQYWIDCFKSYDCNFGYNIERYVDNVTAAGASYETLKNGKYTITWEQFFEIICWLVVTSDSIPSIAKRLGVNQRTIYQIYFKENYSEMTKELSFQQRKLGMSVRKLSDVTVLEIIKSLKNCEHQADIAKKYNVSNSTVWDIYKKKTWKELTKDVVFPETVRAKGRYTKPVSQYTLDGKHIKTYKSAREAEKDIGIGYKYISSNCNNKCRTTHGFIFKFANA